MNSHLDPQQIELTLERVLLEVERPARYIGGEYNSITKQWTADRLKVALCFPDIYDLGTPNLGLATLYQILNRHADLLAERVFLPWVDMEAVMQREGLPLYSLESKHPVQNFDMLGISLPYSITFSLRRRNTAESGARRCSALMRARNYWANSEQRLCSWIPRSTQKSPCKIWYCRIPGVTAAHCWLSTALPIQTPPSAPQLLHESTPRSPTN